MADDFRVGGVTFPLDADLTVGSTLLVADPALYFALDFIGAMITLHVGDRLIAEATAVSAPIASAVAIKLPYDPGKYLMQTNVKLPALFIARQSGVNDYRTVSKWHETTTWTVTYVLPALTPAQAQHIQPILSAIEKCVTNRIEHGSDSGYTPPGEALGEPVWPLTGIEKISLTNCHYGDFEGVGDIALPAVVMTLEVKEINILTRGVQLDKIEAQVDLVDPGDDSRVPHVADVDSDTNVPP